MNHNDSGEGVAFVRDLFAGARDGLAIFDRELRCVHMNAAMEALTFQALAAVLGRPLSEFVPKQGLEDEQSRFERVLAGHHVRVEHSSWSEGPAFYAPLFAPGGDSLGGYVVVRSGQSRRRVEQQLEESEGRFRAMADGAPMLLWMSGRDGQFCFFNQTWLEFRGRRQEEERGTAWYEGVHPEDLAYCTEVYDRAFGARREFQRVYRLRRHDGQYRFVLDHGKPRYTPDQELCGFIGCAIDITDRKQMEDELRHSAERLERSNAELERFAYAASHDLQEPLRMVASYTKLLREKYGPSLDEQAQKYLDFAHDGAVRMRALIDGLLSVSRVKLLDEATRQHVELSSVVSDALANLQLAIDETHAEVSVGPLPALDGHRAQLVQLFQNLLGNALKFQSSEAPKISISAEQTRSDEYTFSIKDNGIGMPSDQVERAFHLFQRLHSRKRYPGSGIGLALCKQVVEHHGGRIWLSSEPGQGTCVRFTLKASAH